MARVHFTLDFEGPLKSKNFEWMKNLHGVLRGNKWTMSPGLLDVALGLSKRDGSNT